MTVAILCSSTFILVLSEAFFASSLHFFRTPLSLMHLSPATNRCLSYISSRKVVDRSSNSIFTELLATYSSAETCYKGEISSKKISLKKSTEQLWSESTRFTKNAVQLVTEWVQRNKPESLPLKFQEFPVANDVSINDSLATLISMEVEVLGIGREKGGAVRKKQEAKELACQAWLITYIGMQRMLSMGWITFSIKNDEIASVIATEIYDLREKGRWQQALNLYQAVFKDLTISKSTKENIKCDSIYSIFKATLSVLCNSGRQKEALQVLSEMKIYEIPETLEVYNLMISMCEMAGNWKLASQLFARMKQDAIQPDLSTYNSLIEVLGAGGQWQEALSLLNDICSSSIVSVEQSTFISSIRACTKSHKFDEVIALLDLMKANNLNLDSSDVYNDIIRACARAREPSTALKLLERMESDGFEPSSQSYDGVILALGDSGKLDSAISLFDRMCSKGITPTVSNYNTLIDACTKSGKWKKAVQVFRQISEKGLRPDIVSYNNLLVSLRAAGEVDFVMEVFFELRLKSKLRGKAAVKPNEITCSCVVKALTEAKRPDLALKAFDIMRTEKIKMDTVAFNTALGACGANRDWQRAMTYFKEMKTNVNAGPDKYTYSILISVMDVSGEGEAALALFEEMRNNGLELSEFSYNSAISACRHLNENGNRAGWDRAIGLMKRMKSEKKASISHITYNAAMLVAGSAGCWEDALALFNSMSTSTKKSANNVAKRVSSSYHQIISILAEANQCDGILALLGQAFTEKIELDVRTYRIAAEACVSAKKWSQVETIILDQNGPMAIAGIVPDTYCYTVLLEAYRQSNVCAVKMNAVLDRMRSMGIVPRPEALMILIRAYGDLSEWNSAEKLIEESKERKLDLYNSLLACCARAGNSNRALFYMEVMREKGVQPDVHSYNHIIRSFSKFESEVQLQSAHHK